MPQTFSLVEIGSSNDHSADFVRCFYNYVFAFHIHIHGNKYQFVFHNTFLNKEKLITILCEKYQSWPTSSFESNKGLKFCKYF